MSPPEERASLAVTAIAATDRSGKSMSAPIQPIATSLPGIGHLSCAIDLSSETATFVDKGGQARSLRYEFGTRDQDVWLTVSDDVGSFCTFEPCPAPNSAFWFATGLSVAVTGCGIASHIYALARDLLKPFGASITPSGNLFPDGVRLWNMLDNAVQFRPHPTHPGNFEPC